MNISAVLDGDFVPDLLVAMYVHGAIFPWGLRDSNRLSSHALYTACSSLVEVLLASPEVKALPAHPLYVLWPKCQEQPITKSLINERARAWRAVGFVERRVKVLSRMMNELTTTDDQFVAYGDELTNACVDLLNFSRSVSLHLISCDGVLIQAQFRPYAYGAIVANSSVFCILRGIASFRPVKQIMTGYLGQKSYEDSVEILSRIICRLLPITCVTNQTLTDARLNCYNSTHNSLFHFNLSKEVLEEKDYHRFPTLSSKFLRYMTRVAETHQVYPTTYFIQSLATVTEDYDVLRRALLDAVMHALPLISKDELRQSSVFDGLKGDPPSPTLAHSEIAEMLQSVRSLGDLLKDTDPMFPYLKPNLGKTFEFIFRSAVGVDQTTMKPCFMSP